MGEEEQKQIVRRVIEQGFDEPMSADVIDVVRIEGGKIVEHWGVPDRLAILRQLGHA